MTHGELRCQTDGLPLLAAMVGAPITHWTPVLATIIWCVVFVAVAVWRFRLKEFQASAARNLNHDGANVDCSPRAAEEAGFEPANGGSKVRCLTTWRLLTVTRIINQFPPLTSLRRAGDSYVWR